MKFLNILEIAARASSGIIVVGFILGLCLRKKHEVFENMALNTAFMAIMIGLGWLFIFAIVGWL